jgi:hypothetical protein
MEKIYIGEQTTLEDRAGRIIIEQNGQHVELTLPLLDSLETFRVYLQQKGKL